MEGTKDEYMTCLSGDRLVSKTQGRIVFRGLIDTLEAEVIEAQVLAAELGKNQEALGSLAPRSLNFCSCLGEILDYLRLVLASEVKEKPLAPPFLFGMGPEEIHRRSHEAKVTGADGKAVPPSYFHGALAARLNTLRARVREAEIVAVKVFGPRDDSNKTEAENRGDIILALNRLSSAFWWLFCECAKLTKEDPE